MTVFGVVLFETHLGPFWYFGDTGLFIIIHNVFEIKYLIDGEFCQNSSES